RDREFLDKSATEHNPWLTTRVAATRNSQLHQVTRGSNIRPIAEIAEVVDRFSRPAPPDRPCSRNSLHQSSCLRSVRPAQPQVGDTRLHAHEGEPSAVW